MTINILSNKITTDLNLQQEYIDDLLKSPYQKIKHIKIKKNNSDNFRLIKIPDKRAVIIQRWLMQYFFSSFRVHDFAVAYKKGTSIISNATFHANSKYFLKLDFKNFFSSINFKDIRMVIQDNQDVWNTKYFITSKDEELILKTCFDENRNLAMGYPCSPMLSNIVMYNFDVSISSYLKTNFKGTVYTRYSDDLIISSDNQDDLIRIYPEIVKLINSWDFPKIELNKKKTKFQSALKGNAIITGVKVCHDGHLTIHRKMKDHIRLLLSLNKKGLLADNDIVSLKGYLSYIHFAEPSFYTKLAMKYPEFLRR